MNSLLLKKAQKIEERNRVKALKTAGVLHEQMEIAKENSLAPYSLHLGSHVICFDSFKVVYEPLKGHWVESEASIESYIRLFDNIRVWLYVCDQDCCCRRVIARIALYENDEIINDEYGFLTLIKK